MSYNTALDTGGISALSMAIHTASRYKGEIFADHGDGVMKPFRSYRQNEVKDGVSSDNE